MIRGGNEADGNKAQTPLQQPQQLPVQGQSSLQPTHGQSRVTTTQGIHVVAAPTIATTLCTSGSTLQQYVIPNQILPSDSNTEGSTSLQSSGQIMVAITPNQSGTSPAQFTVGQNSGFTQILAPQDCKQKKSPAVGPEVIETVGHSSLQRSDETTQISTVFNMPITTPQVQLPRTSASSPQDPASFRTSGSVSGISSQEALGLHDPPAELISQRSDSSPLRKNTTATTMIVKTGNIVQHHGQNPVICSSSPISTPLSSISSGVQSHLQKHIIQRRTNIVCTANVVGSVNSSPKSTVSPVTGTFRNPVNSGSVRTSPFQKHKRIKLEEKPPANEEIANLRRVICEHSVKKFKFFKENYVDHITELFFLQNGGNMMDFLTWKKRPSSQFVSYLKANALDSDEEDQLINTDIKFSVISTATVAVSTSPPSCSQSQIGGSNLVPDQITSALLKSTPTSPVSSHQNVTTLNTTTVHQDKNAGLSPVTSIPRTSLSVTLSTTSVTTTMTPTTGKSHRLSTITSVPPVRLQTRQHSISAVYDSSIGSQEEIVERAKQEAFVMQKIAELRKEGLWSEKRLPKVQEPPRNKAHWDYLLEEMVWLATDFAQERKWKKAAAKKCARMCQKFHQEQKLKEERAEKEAEQKLKRIAGAVAKEIKQFWANVEKLVEYKQQSRLEEKRKKVLDLHLNFIVDQTEKYSSWLAQGMNKSFLESTNTSLGSSAHESRSSTPGRSSASSSEDADFQPETSDDEADDEETIAKEEAQGTDDNAQQKELELLQKEGIVPLEDLLKSLPVQMLDKPGSPLSIDDSTHKDNKLLDDNKLDSEFRISSDEDTDDDEATLDEQENEEKNFDHEQEIKELQEEGDLSLEELLKKYSAVFENEPDELKSEFLTSDESPSEDEREDSDEDSDDTEDTEDEEIHDIGIETLINFPTIDDELKKEEDTIGKGPTKEITDIAADAESFQPKGYTYLTAQVATKVPFLLKHQLREYQHIGLDWLVTMHDRKLNGILADEMGLGKTIQTIALLAHLACEKGNWGPHLIVVPTSVMLNWEMEFKKWCPAFKILTYYGSQKERKQKRQGWTKPNAFHVCITSYKLVIQDHQAFRRKKWKYFILDEAQNIKNFKSQRWQLLLNFQSQRRLLLTGTPLQNSLMELWSLMHFLMPNVFQSHRDFKEWFANPLSGMIEGSHEYNENLIKRLHKVLRPFLLRRLKSEVEKQLPMKYEHIIMCRLSKRQRFLYDDFMSQAKTKETLASGNFMSVINVLMQLRKVCNHPNLFEARPIVSPFQMEGICFWTSSHVYSLFEYDPFKHVDLYSLNLRLADLELCLTAFAAHRIKRFQTPKKLIEEIDNAPDPPPKCPPGKIKLHVRTSTPASQAPSGRSSPLVPAAQRPTSPLMRTLTPVVSATIAQDDLSLVAGTQVKTIVSSSPVSQQTIPLTVSTAQGSPLPGYTLQLVQQQPQGLPVAQLTPTQVVTSTPITVQIQQTQQGPRITVPAGQLAQIPAGFAQIVQTSTGQHILLTSNPQILQPVQTSLSTSAAAVGTAAQITQHGTTNPQTSSNATATVAANTRSPTVPSSHLSKPLMRVQPLNATQTSVATHVTSSLSKSVSCSKPVTRADSVKDLATHYAKNLDTITRSLFYLDELVDKRKQLRKQKLQLLAKFNTRRCEACPIYGSDLIKALTLIDEVKPVKQSWKGLGYVHCLNAVNPQAHPSFYWYQTEFLEKMMRTPQQYLYDLEDILKRYVFLVPAVAAPTITMHVSHPPPSKTLSERQQLVYVQKELSPLTTILHPIASAMTTMFPDARLIQYDCGKLQTLDPLLRRLKSEGHRVLIFTQMTRMLDVLEQFLNYHGHIYLRLDGTTRVEQRQALMERFNADRRIFCFILSTRSGGIGVNLTGADTVIFYDSDWNPTMDAQAQDRCHRIGQTRDVHIYRLISMRTVEENILKKANQKRLLGEVAIEGGNFTTAFFHKHTIQELFDVNFEEIGKEICVKKEAVEEVNGDNENITTAQLEIALAQAEEDTDVQAAKTAKAEAAAELAEFDESIPYEGDSKVEDEMSKVEEELGALTSQLTPVERYAMAFLESIQEPFSLEQLKQAEEEIEAQKKDWELGRLQAMKEEEERRAQLEDDDIPYTYSREDAYNQVYVSYIGREQMPVWAPPTPPQDENDVYIDYSLCFLFEPSVMPESQLPPVYIKREQKRIRVDTVTIGRKQKVRKDDSVSVPRSLFDRPTAAVMKMRREAKLQKIRGIMKPSVMSGYKPPAVINKPIMDTQQDHPEWLIHEDWALLQAVQTLLELPLNLTVLSPAHIPNWDMVADVVNATSRIYRSPKQCKNRYESVIVPREEGKILYDTNPKKQKKSKGIYRTKNNRPMRTSQLFVQDNNTSFSQLYHQRFETIKSVANKRTPTLKPLLQNPAFKNPKHAAVVSESNINYEQPLTPVQVAAIRADRIAREKQKSQAAAAAAAEQQLAAQRQQQTVAQHVAAAVSQQAVVGLTPAQQLQSVISVAAATTSGLAGTPNINSTICTQRTAQAGLTVRSLANASGSQAVVSLTPAQVQAATRITAANLAAVTSVSAGVMPSQVTTQTATKNLTVQQIQALRTQSLMKQQQQQQQRIQELKQQQQLKRLQVAQQQQQQQQQQQASGAAIGGTNQSQKVSVAVSSPITASGVAAIQVTQAQQRAQAAKHPVKPARSMTDADLAQIMKRQQKAVTAATAGQVAQIQVPAQSQILTHAQLQHMQPVQTPVATLVKTVSAPSLSANTSVIPMNAAVSLGIPNVKASVTTGKTGAVTQQSQFRQLQIQQQLLQRKVQQQQTQKVAHQLTQVQGKSQMSTQLGTVQIVQQVAAASASSQSQKSLPATVTVQHIQQVIKQVTASGTSPVAAVATQSSAVTQAQVLPHAVLTKSSQATVSLGQTTTTVPATLHSPTAQSLASNQTVQARVIPVNQTVTQVVAASTASPAAAAIKQSIQQVVSATTAPSFGQSHVHTQPLVTSTCASLDSTGRSYTIAGQTVSTAVVSSPMTSGTKMSASTASPTPQTTLLAQVPVPSLQQSSQSIAMAVRAAAPLQGHVASVQVPPSQSIVTTAATTQTIQAVPGGTTNPIVASGQQASSSPSVPGSVQANQTVLQQAKLQAAQQGRGNPYTMRLRNPPKQ